MLSLAILDFYLFFDTYLLEILDLTNCLINKKMHRLHKIIT